MEARVSHFVIKFLASDGRVLHVIHVTSGNVVSALAFAVSRFGQGSYEVEPVTKYVIETQYA